MSEDKKPQNQNGDASKIQEELEQANAKLTELTEISQRALADLQNYKKRTEDEKAAFITFANAALITELLPVLDNIERAIAHTPEEAKEWATGVTGTLKQLEDVLTRAGLAKIEAQGEFNPEMHEAVSMQPGEKDHIIQNLETGYKIGERVIRRSKVIVGNGEK